MNAKLLCLVVLVGVYCTAGAKKHHGKHHDHHQVDAHLENHQLRWWNKTGVTEDETRQLVTSVLKAYQLALLPVHDPHNYTEEFHDMRFIKDRGKAIRKFGQVAGAIQKGSGSPEGQQQHRYCSLAGRDNWVCTGKRYEAMLRATLPFNRSLSLDAFPEGTRIFVEGNSFLAEKVAIMICGSSGTEFWKVDGKVGNSMLAYNFKRKVGIFMLDNDWQWNPHFDKTKRMLKDVWPPTLIVLGDLNSHLAIKASDATARLAEYRHAFPSAPVIACGGRSLPTSCAAMLHGDHSARDIGKCTNLTNDQAGQQVHECVPGPINRYAEHMVRIWLAQLNPRVAASGNTATINPAECENMQLDADPASLQM